MIPPFDSEQCWPNHAPRERRRAVAVAIGAPRGREIPHMKNKKLQWAILARLTVIALLLAAVVLQPPA
jgi:hypothetical protein